MYLFHTLEKKMEKNADSNNKWIEQNLNIFKYRIDKNSSHQLCTSEQPKLAQSLNQKNK